MEYMAYCGLLCNECPVYIATETKDEETRARLAEEYSGNHIRFSAEDINCHGCFHEETGYSKICASCEIRNCARPKGLRNCGYCADYPCTFIESHVPEGLENRALLDRLKKGL